MKKTVAAILELVFIVFVVLLIVVPLRTFVFQPFLVRGSSMEPNYQNGDYLIVDEVTFRFREPARGEVIVFKFPQNPSQRYIKRIIGLPGETVEISRGRVDIYKAGEGEKKILDESAYLPAGTATDGQLTKELGPNEYFVMGDNREFSSDSRAWGEVPRDAIVGKVFVRIFPLSAFAYIDAPSY